MTAIILAGAVSFLAGIAFQRALTAYRIGQRKAARDEYRFQSSTIVQHSTEDAIRQAGC